MTIVTPISSIAPLASQTMNVRSPKSVIQLSNTVNMITPINVPITLGLPALMTITPRKTAVNPWIVKVPPPISDTPEPNWAVARIPAIEANKAQTMK